MTPEQARRELIRIAEGQVGTQEQGGNNRGPKIAAYQRATWLDPDPWPWCAAFVDWCIMEWLKIDGVMSALSLSNHKLAEAWRPKTAGAFDLANWAKQKGLKVLDETAHARSGDIVIFDFSHVGFVAEDAPPIFSNISTIEGNTNASGNRDSNSGDGVWRKIRARSLARYFIRLV